MDTVPSGGQGFWHVEFIKENGHERGSCPVGVPEEEGSAKAMSQVPRAFAATWLITGPAVKSIVHED